MRETRDIMGMPVTVEIADRNASQASFEKAFEFFKYVDRTFSTYKKDSEISRINRGEVAPAAYSATMKEIFRLAEKTKAETSGFFDIRTPEGQFDPSGIVKGWAIEKVAELLRGLGHHNLYVEAGGDIQTDGANAEGRDWRIGIRNPFEHAQIVKVVRPRGKGVATSGIAARGTHIYDPHTKAAVATSLASITVIGPDIYEADRFATAAFAMGERGVQFIQDLEGFEAYAVDSNGIATETSGFARYL